MNEQRLERGRALIREAYPDAEWTSERGVSLDISGLKVHLDASQSVGARASGSSSVRLRISMPAAVPVCIYASRRSVRRLGTGLNPLETGDSRFDEAFKLRGVPEDLVREVFDEQLRAALCEHSDRAAEVEVDDGEIRCQVPVGSTTAPELQDLVETLAYLDSRVWAVYQSRVAVAGTGRGELEAAMQAELASLRARQKRASLLTIAFVLLMLGAVVGLVVWALS